MSRDTAERDRKRQGSDKEERKEEAGRGMAAKKYYAVKRGKATGIFRTWEECRACVEGYPGAVYKGFPGLEEAESYLGLAPGTGKISGGRSGSGARAKASGQGTGNGGLLPEQIPDPGGPDGGSGGDAAESLEKNSGRENIKGAGHSRAAEKCGKSRGHAVRRKGKADDAGSGEGAAEAGSGRGEQGLVREGDEVPAAGTLLAYVDGSYDNSLKKYAFGCVFILPDGKIYTEYGNGDNAQSLQHRNVTGEMLGAMYAVKTAMRSGFSAVELCYDYEGIEKWVTGAWRSKTELTQKYAAAMREWKKSIGISFRKVAAHTNVYYNELADRMAKTGLREGDGIPKVQSLE